MPNGVLWNTVEQSGVRHLRGTVIGDPSPPQDLRCAAVLLRLRMTDCLRKAIQRGERHAGCATDQSGADHVWTMTGALVVAGIQMSAPGNGQKKLTLYGESV